MFTGIYRDSAGVFCNICRENPIIFTDFPCNPPAICKYYRVFPADIAENPCRVPVNPCKHLQCRCRGNPPKSGFCYLCRFFLSKFADTYVNVKQITGKGGRVVKGLENFVNVLNGSLFNIPNFLVGSNLN